jgi:hypothetical protein
MTIRKRLNQFTILFLFVLIPVHTIAQSYNLINKHKQILSIGQGGEFGYFDDGSGYDYRIIESVKYGYFFSNRFVPFLGIDLLYGKTASYDYKTNEFIYAFSAGSRYFFTKKNLLFMETSIQAGGFNAKGSASENYRFAQIGIGGGLNFLLAQGIGQGKLAMEILFRYNFELMDRPQFSRIDVTLSTLGTSIGLNYVFSGKVSAPLPAKESYKTSPVRIKSLHILKTDIPFKISYCYERSLGKETAISFGVTAKEVSGLFSADHYFVPGIKIEPRYYYGYNKRYERGQTISNNSSDFLAFELSYQWLWKYDPTDKYWQISIIPKWGLRRAIGKHFIIEGALGASFFTTIEKTTSIAPHFETNFGYAF